jgi:hypothetical protein
VYINKLFSTSNFGIFLGQRGTEFIELGIKLMIARKIQLLIFKIKYTMSDILIFLDIGGVVMIDHQGCM